MHPDGDGLYAQVKGQTCSWLFRYGFRKKSRSMGLGSLKDVSLAQARAKAAECRLQKANGQDPLEVRQKERSRSDLAAARKTTFQDCTDAYVETHRAAWNNAKHAQQWTNTIGTYAGPVIGHLPVQDVDTSLVVKVLKPIWTTKAETASRLRGRIEAVLDWAKTSGLRDGENPARWRGHLKHQLANTAKLRKGGHHASLAYHDIGRFTAELRALPGNAARALEFTILTAARTGEVLGARWTEIDLALKIWTVPAARMKAGREHKVPLSDAALAVLASQSQKSEYVFPGASTKRPLSSMAMAMVLRRMNRPDITVHGFRSTFRVWVAEGTDFQREVAEAALAHVSGDKTEAAYLRSSFFLKRARLMELWATYCGDVRTDKNVVRFSDAATG